jgi:para-nitrobenzyl esterase
LVILLIKVIFFTYSLIVHLKKIFKFDHQTTIKLLYMNKKTVLLIFAPMIVASALLIPGCAGKAKILDPIVQTLSGLVQGVVNESGTVVSFKGIPYAAPPVGDLRWREPQPPLSWEGVRDASRFCSSCIQVRDYSRLPHTEEFMIQDSISEDCLFLNLWTPAKTAEDKVPVLVFMHGGGFTEGSGSVLVYDGEELAKKGIIVITVNYRLGALGFLAHPELTAESPNHVSGNYGLLDQIAALQWIQNNIAAFGGDPGRVTVAGQSAGAMSVRALILSPLAKGLFHRGITESGSSYANFMSSGTLADAESMGVEFMKAKGASTIAELRAMDAMEVFKPVEGQTVRFNTVIDGYFMPDNTNNVFDAGKQNDTPFMTGLNADEVRYTGDTGDALVALYPADSLSASVKEAAQEQGRLNAWLWLDYRAKTSFTNGYVYYFSRAIPWPEHPEFGAFHTSEVPYVFNNLRLLNRPFTATDTMVADMMSTYWANFVKNGDPNGEGLPEWRPYSPDKKEVMELGEHMGMIPIAKNEERYIFILDQLLKPMAAAR